MFQSTRPQGARRVLSRSGVREGFVSIHAPAGGATSARLPPKTKAKKFQSTRPRGARHSAEIEMEHTGMFQSTRPQGARRVRLTERLIKRSFNPRARRGRDQEPDDNTSTDSGFNPRARGGRDLFFGQPITLGQLFQSTRPRGARRSLVHQKPDSQWFQSTRPRGARPLTYAEIVQYAKFQSTRPRGARPYNLIYNEWIRDVSIHAPAGGATSGLTSGMPSPASFNPRARGGRDLVCYRDIPQQYQFQSTRPRGARLNRCGQHVHDDQFQSTRPRGARPTVF